LSVDDAYQVTPLVRRMYEAGGAKVIGRKIGFTNRTIWSQYGVYAPIWGYVFDRGLHDLAAIERLPSAPFSEPRIEPEIIFCLSAAPSARMDEMALSSCIDWVALGFEIVQSIFPGWKFSAADTVAANGVHGALLTGPRHRFAGDPLNPPLAAGEIISTGTLTKAMPVAAGEVWTATPTGIALDEIRIRFG
jgi:2-oxo-3-hexenedioate decarboxylase